MVNITIERVRWQTGKEAIDRHVNGVVSGIMQSGVPTVSVMSMDIVFRAYMQWLNAAMVLNEDAESTHKSLRGLCDVMILEFMARTNKIEDGVEPVMEWIERFIDELYAKLVEDVEAYVRSHVEGQVRDDSPPSTPHS